MALSRTKDSLLTLDWIFNPLKMIRFSLITICLITLYSCKETLFVIENQDGKYKVQEGMTIAITKKGESYPFDIACKTTCKECDPLLAKSRWIVDSIRSKEIVLKYERVFTYDTLTSQEFRSVPKKERQSHFYKVIAINKKAHYVYKIPVEVDYMSIAFDTLETITYSDARKCYKGSPIKSIFSNPNKIHRVNMKGATVNVEYH